MEFPVELVRVHPSPYSALTKLEKYLMEQERESETEGRGRS